VLEGLKPIIEEELPLTFRNKIDPRTKKPKIQTELTPKRKIGRIDSAVLQNKARPRARLETIV